MLNIYPTLYRISASSCGALTTIPLDILQTKIFSNQPIEFKLEEFKIMFLMTALFSIQNGVYNWSTFLNNKSIRGSLAGLSAAPFYIFLESKKLYLRLGLEPKYKNFIFWITLRQIVMMCFISNRIWITQSCIYLMKRNYSLMTP